MLDCNGSFLLVKYLTYLINSLKSYCCICLLANGFFKNVFSVGHRDFYNRVLGQQDKIYS